MKKILLTAFLSFVGVAGFACTNLIVGKRASVDGSVMCTYNCDGFGFAASLSWSAPGRHAPGEMIAVRGWGPESAVHQVAQADYTYGVVGLMNELQVSIVETTWDGRKELRNPEGALDYFTLMHLTLQRSASAREAIAVMHNLVQEYGYNATGES
ncbi:MAG: C69 family dipeptidase, partial [Bacteroidales bacterium]|nr:C69 family dipeptidase [Bacteroidales bacterium]